MLFHCCHFPSIFAKLVADSVYEILQKQGSLKLSNSLFCLYLTKNGNLGGKLGNKIIDKEQYLTWQTDPETQLLVPCQNFPLLSTKQKARQNLFLSQTQVTAGFSCLQPVHSHTICHTAASVFPAGCFFLMLKYLNFITEPKKDMKA